jgi:hypothetical protein
MNRLLNILIFLIILPACAQVQTPQSLPSVIPTVSEPVQTSTSTPIPVLLFPTNIPVACDPFIADYCIIAGPFILRRPVKPPANDSVDSTYRYGSTANGTRDPHHGVEFVNESGTPVYAAADGKVIFAGPDEEAIYSSWANYYGNLVVIEHADGLFTLYAHLSKIDIQAGQEALVGDKIGEVGRTGVAIGSHLHFEVRLGDVQDYFGTQNPELWLAPSKYQSGDLSGTLMISIVDQRFGFQYAEFTINHYPDPNQPQAKSYYVTTYTRDMMTGDENAVLGDLPSGHYRIALEHNGGHYERRVEVESGKLTQVVLFVK